MKIALTATVSVLVLASLPALAAEKTQTVMFKKGTTSAMLSGSVKGYDTVSYMLGASAGQVMSVQFAPQNNSCYFNVIPPGGSEAIHMGEVAGNSFSGTLSVSGKYKTQVYLMRSAARRGETCKYSIKFEVTGAISSAPASAGVSDGEMRKICKGEAAGMYNLRPNYIKLDNNGKVFPATDGFAIEGEADLGSQGTRRFTCIFGKDRSFKTVDVGNADGE